MKTIILIIGLSVGLMGQAPAQTNQPGSPAEVTNGISSDTLVTKSGAVYEKFYIERVDPAGLTVSYVLTGGGLGMERVPFDVLPDDWQRRYRYDPEKAAKFDLEQKKAMAQLRERMIAEENAYREKRAREEAAEEAAAEQAKIDAEAAKKALESAATQTTNSLAMTNLLAMTNSPEMTNLPAMSNTNQPAPPSPPGRY
ncbi:MAG: hypothetical protein ABSH11_02120 [Verrucomicrobiota bacterium]|jgi:hypothetical protein